MKVVYVIDSIIIINKLMYLFILEGTCGSCSLLHSGVSCDILVGDESVHPCDLPNVKISSKSYYSSDKTHFKMNIIKFNEELPKGGRYLYKVNKSLFLDRYIIKCLRE